MLNNFFKVVAEIWKLQQNNLYAVGLVSKSQKDGAVRAYALRDLASSCLF